MRKNVKAVVAAFNQEKALVGAFSVITNLRMELFQALVTRQCAGPQAMAPISVPTLLRRVVEAVPGQAALQTRDRSWSYAEYSETVAAVARAFIALGLERFHTVSCLGQPSPCQHIANMAAIHAGGFVGGMYQTNTAEACMFMARDSRANIIVVSDQLQLDKILAIR